MGNTTPHPAPNPPPPAGVACTLQLYCDLTTSQARTNGRFADNTATNPSKIWTFSGNGAPGPTSDHVLALNKSGGNPISVTFTFNLPAGATIADVQGTVSFGRDHNSSGSSATYASPFQYNAGVRTVFGFEVTSPTNSPLTVYLGAPALFSNTPGGKDCYAFIVGIRVDVTTGSTTTPYWISHDPEMEINM